MKYKKILCLGIAAIMFITGTVFCVSAESTVSVSEHEKTEKNVNTEFDQIGEVIEIPCENLYSTRATTKRYSINWTVPAGAALSGSSEIYSRGWLAHTHW